MAYALLFSLTKKSQYDHLIAKLVRRAKIIEQSYINFFFTRFGKMKLKNFFLPNLV